MKMDNFPVLSTKRLQLRQLDASDASGLFRLRSNEEYCKFTRMNRYESIEKVMDFIKRMDAAYIENASIMWTIALKGLDTHIGGVCLFNYSSDRKRAEIGYDLIPEFRGSGYVTEALNAVIPYGFNDMGFDVIFADLMPANTKSISVLERNGFIKKSSRTDTDGNGAEIEMALYEIEQGNPTYIQKLI